MNIFLRLLRFVDELLIIVGLLVVSALVYFAYVAQTARDVGEIIQENAAENFTAINAVETKDGKKLAPIAAYAEYRRCGSGVFSARLSGEPLACSASNITDTLLSDPGQAGQTFYRQFGAACNRHDLCYVHGDVTYGATRKQCDQAFLGDILKTCKLIYSDRPRVDLFGIKLPVNLRRYCELRAVVGYSAVRALGWQYFYNNYSPVCDYESGPHAVRDHIVSGKFLGEKRDYVVSIRLMSDQDSVKVTLSEINDNGQSEEIELAGAVVSARTVPVMDRDKACVRVSQHSRSDKLCPEDFKLGSTLVTARDWLRFTPVVVDHDGDGADEIILVSVSPDFGLGFTHLKFDQSFGRTELSASAYLGVDRRTNRGGAADCEWGLEFHNCHGPQTLDEAFILKAPKRYERAVKKLEIAQEELAEAEVESNAEKIADAKKAIASAKETIRRTKAYRSGSEVEKIRSWRAEMTGFDKSAVRKENHFVLSNEGTTQKTMHQLIPLRVAKDDDDGWAQDLVLMSAHAFTDEAGDEDSGHAFRRFHFDGDTQRWVMTRDLFTRDGHLTAKCSFDDDQERRRYDQYRRYQYRAFPMRLHGFGDDRLATFQREKCPTSSINPAAGSLGDVDVMVYSLERDYSEMSDFRDKENPRDSRLLNIAHTSWFPLIWSEAAHPLISSEAAREKKIHMVGSYVGGAAKITYPVISVLRDNQDLHVRMLRAAERRLPDTYGKIADRYYVRWNKKKLGLPESYYQLPSVLASFDAEGKDGISLVFFSNRATFEWSQKMAEEKAKVQAGAKPGEGRFRALIVPIPKAYAREFAKAKIVECSVTGVRGHGRKSFSPRYRAGKKGFSVREKSSDHKVSEWQEHFLRHEPVISGQFGLDGAGALAASWRAENGDIAVTALMHDGDGWRFGQEACDTVASVEVDRLY